MTDHASLLRQIHTEARPYVENALELAEVFVGFRKLASETGELIEIHREPSNRDVSTDGKASSAAASQGQAAHAGTGSETLASHEGDTRGEGASVLSPINSEASSREKRGLDASGGLASTDPETSTSPGCTIAQVAANRDVTAGETASPIHSAPPIADQGLDSIGIPLPELLSSPAEFPDLPKQFDRRASA